MVVKELGGGVAGEKKEMAALGQKGLPVGPVLPITSPVTKKDIEAQIEKNNSTLSKYNPSQLSPVNM